MRTKSKARCAVADGYQNPASVERGRRLSGGVHHGGRGTGPGDGGKGPGGSSAGPGGGRNQLTKKSGGPDHAGGAGDRAGHDVHTAAHADQQHSPSLVIQTPRAGRKKKRMSMPGSGRPSKLSTPIKMKSSESKSKYYRDKQAE